MADERPAALLCDACGQNHAANPRAHEGAVCTCGEGNLRRYLRAAPGSVVLDRDHAEAALLEVEAAIRRTGGPDGFEVGQHERESMTPLAIVRRELEDKAARADDVGDERAADALRNAVGVVETVGELAGEETSPDVDPLTDATFQARKALRAALDRDRADPPEPS